MTFSGNFLPYAVDIDPGTAEGAKLYRRAVKEDCPDDERTAVSSAKPREFMASMTNVVQTYCLHDYVHQIPVNFEMVPDGTVAVALSQQDAEELCTEFLQSN